MIGVQATEMVCPGVHPVLEVHITEYAIVVPQYLAICGLLHVFLFSSRVVLY